MSKSGIVSGLLFVAVVIWLAMGSSEPQIESNVERLEAPLQRVQAEWITSTKMNREIKLSGTTAANRVIDIRSQIKSTVQELNVIRGTDVKQGQVLVTLDPRDWPAKVAQFEALVSQRQLELASTKKLFARDLASKNQLAAKQTELASAVASLSNAQENLDSTTLTAPFDGVVDHQSVEIGDSVRDGTTVMRLIDLSPLIIDGKIPERLIGEINVGDLAYAILPNGTKLDGVVNFISAEADPNTRSYDIEIEISQYEGRIASGLTAAIYLPQPLVNSYFVSPALLVLNETGQLSVKTLTSDNRVSITPVKLLRAENDGIWIYGPNDSLNLIVMGHGFVEESELVQPVYASVDGE